MKPIPYFILVCIGALLVASASAGAGDGCQGASLPGGTISPYIKGSINDPDRTEYLHDLSIEFKQSQAYFDSTKTFYLDRKTGSLNDSPPKWPWQHSLGDTFYHFNGTKWVEDPGHCWTDPESCSSLDLFSGFSLKNIW